MVYNHVVEEPKKNDEIGLRGFGLNFLIEKGGGGKKIIK